ncbi:MAG: hypothetical protein ACRDR6_28565, partial [Pseudonocardiaceae bacterium]
MEQSRGTPTYSGGLPPEQPVQVVIWRRSTSQEGVAAGRLGAMPLLPPHLVAFLAAVLRSPAT